MTLVRKNLVPKLRFPNYSGKWEETRIGELLVPTGDSLQPLPNTIYREIGVRSHGKGIFHKDSVTSAELGDKRVFWVTPNSLVLNIVFAWEQAVALTTVREKGFIASHRFPMFLARKGKSNLAFVRELFLTKRGKRLLEMASPGGAGRNKTLGKEEFLRLKVNVPSVEEQKTIVTFLKAIDDKLDKLRKKRVLLADYKRGVMQQVFSQTIRFRHEVGTAFPDWEDKLLGDVLVEHKSKSTGIEEVFSVSVHKGLVNQIEHLGRSFSAKDTDHYKRVLPGDLVYTKSPTGEFPLGIVKQSKLDVQVIVSPLYGVFSPVTKWLGFLLDAYFSSKVNISNYLKPIVQKGAKNTIIVTNDGFLSGRLQLPIDPYEQKQIAKFLMALDTKINVVARQIKKTEDFKKGLLQRMFV